MENHRQHPYPITRPADRALLANSTRPGGYWDSRFWNPPILREVHDRQATKANVPRQPVTKFQTIFGVACSDDGTWMCGEARMPCSLHHAARRLGVAPSFLSMWTQLYCAGRRRATRAQLEQRRTLQPPSPGPLSARAARPDSGNRTWPGRSDFEDERGWWHSDC